MTKQTKEKNYEQPVVMSVFQELKKKRSGLLSLFNMNNTEILNVACQAPSPSKDYCQLVLTHDQVIYRWWKIALRGDSESRYPGEIKDSYDDFAHDDLIQRNILYTFGKNMLVYVKNIVEKGRLDYLERMPERVLLKVVGFLQLEDVARLAQVNNFFRDLCRSDKVWMNLYKRNYSNQISKELIQLADRDGWRKLFFTNKIKLQLELRRQAKSNQEDESMGHLNVTPRRSKYSDQKWSSSMARKTLSSARMLNKDDDDDDTAVVVMTKTTRSRQSAADRSRQGDSRLRNSTTFLTEY